MYTVTLYSTPMSFPLNFTIHSWVEISDGSTTDRYDFWAYHGLKTATRSEAHIYQNIFPDHFGTTFSPIAKTDDLNIRQVGKIIDTIFGPIDSPAHRLYQAIKDQAFAYPLKDKYSMIHGPNCNTYTAWLLALVPEANLKLPWYAWGKNYQVPNID